MLAHLSPKERFGYACLIGLLLFAFGFIGARHLRKPAPIVFETKQTSRWPETQSASQSLISNSSPAGEMVVVHVAGAVKNPGVVRLATGSRVVDALDAAGGAQGQADLDAINLAAKLIDGSQVLIPSRGQIESQTSQTDRRIAAKSKKPSMSAQIDKSGTFDPVRLHPSYLATVTPSASAYARAAEPSKAERSKKATSEVNLNSATVEELQNLPGVGPSTAQKIVAFRQQHGPFKSAQELLDVPGIGEKKLAKMQPLIKL